MNLETFQQMPAEQVAQVVRRTGPQVCVFPINGTRRWFLLEHAAQAEAGSPQAYMRLTWQRQIDLYKLFFDHGVDTLLTPIFGPDLLERGAEYQELVEPGLLWITQDQDLLDFYDEYDVRVRVYGDTRRYLHPSYAHVLEAFDELTRRTAAHRRYRLFFGVCAHDATESVAEIGARTFQEQGRLPSRRQIVEAYYGEYVERVDFFIGFDRPASFDMPLIATGSEDLYFTVSPSPYVDAETLRAILYDHLFARRVTEDYGELSATNLGILGEFYKLNRHRVLGLGRQDASKSFWYPLPQVQLPPQLVGDD